MSEYDFHQLSSFEFEMLVRDLLSAEDGVEYELFTAGPDQGIDLRYLPPGSNDCSIVQCKHYFSSTFSKLKSDLAKEKAKVDRLDPSWYRVATSKALSPANKDSIATGALKPHLLNASNVLGRSDINSLIRKHPSVEKAHFKLWLASTAALEAILEKGILGRSVDLMQHLDLKSKLYVMNPSYGKAQKILEREHVCLISGEPGIGKTTLAEMLMLNAASVGFQIVVISEDVHEAERTYSTTGKQIFYYDDFLGQTDLSDRMGKNEDSRLAQLIRRIRKDPNKRLVLTTREYILQDAKRDYERLETAGIDYLKYSLDLRDYGRRIRGRILYNHLYFSNLSHEAVESVIRDHGYRKIIQHSNYNPRLIEHVVQMADSEVEATSFVDFMLATLDNPERLWRHAYEAQIDDEARAVLSVLSTFPKLVSHADLLEACTSYRPDLFRDPSRSLRRALEVLEGTFVTISKAGTDLTIAFKNPSVRDFLLNHLFDPPFVLQVLASATRFEQVQYLAARSIPSRGVEADEGRKRLFDLILTRPSEWSDACASTFEADMAEVVTYYSSFSEVVRYGGTPNLNNRVTSIAAYPFDMPREWWEGLPEVFERHWSLQFWPGSVNRLLSVLSAHRQKSFDVVDQLDIVAKPFFGGKRNSVHDLTEAYRYAKWSSAVSDEERAEVRDALDRQLDELVEELDDIELDQLEDAIHEASQGAKELGLKDDRIDDAQRRLDEREWEHDEDGYSYERTGSPSATEDAEIDAMFESLRNRE